MRRTTGKLEGAELVSLTGTVKVLARAISHNVRRVLPKHKKLVGGAKLVRSMQN